MTERQKHPDRKNAVSILLASKRQMKYTLTIPATDESAFNIIRNIYECFRMLGDALLTAKGIESQDHITPIHELINLQVETTRPTKLIDSLRKTRHNINYYGYTPTKIEADDMISLAKACFEPLASAVQQELQTSTQEQRLFKPHYFLY